MSGLTQTILEVVSKYKAGRYDNTIAELIMDDQCFYFDMFTDEEQGEILAGYLTEILKEFSNECLEDINPRHFAKFMNAREIDYETIGKLVFKAMLNHCHEGIQTLVDNAAK